MASRLDRFINRLPKPIAIQIDRWRGKSPTESIDQPAVASRQDFSTVTSTAPTQSDLFRGLRHPVLLVSAANAIYRLPKNIEVLEEVSANFATRLGEPKLVKDTLLSLQRDLIQSLLHVTEMKRSYAQQTKDNQIPKELNQLYQDQLDNIFDELEQSLIITQQKLTALDPNLMQIPRFPPNGQMNEEEFIKKMESLEVLIDAIKNPYTSTSDREQFFTEGMALVEELRAEQSLHSANFPIDASLRLRFVGLSVDFVHFERLQTNGQPLGPLAAEQTSAMQLEKSHYLTLINKLAYVTSRLEANPTMLERVKFKMEGQALHQALAQLQHKAKHNWQPEAKELQRELEITRRFAALNLPPQARFLAMREVRVFKEVNVMIAERLQHEDLNVNNLLSMQQDITNIQDALQKKKQSLTQQVEELLLSPELNRLYQSQLDKIATELKQNREVVQKKLELYKIASMQTPAQLPVTPTPDSMTQIEFTMKLECLEILYQAATRPTTNDLMRTSFLREALTLRNELSSTYHAKHHLSWTLSKHDEDKFTGLLDKFATLEKQSATKTMAISPRPTPPKDTHKTNKADYIATLDALDYVAARLEANPSADEREKYKEQGSLLKQDLDQLQREAKKKWKFDPSERERDAKIRERYQNAKQSYTPPSLTPSR